MPSTEASGTPATTRKRARNQTSAAGSLSLLAVPKLKVGDLTAPFVAAPSQLARPRESAKPHIGARKLLSESPRQHMKTADTAVHGGKENRSVTNTQPAQANTTKLPVNQSSNKPAVMTGNRPEPKLPAAITAAKTTESYSTIQQTVPTPITSDRLLPSLRHSDKLHGPGATAQQQGTKVDVCSAMLDPQPVEQQQAGCSGIADSPTVCTEVDQAFLAQGVPLACHTAINKRRRPVGQATRYGEWYTGNDTDLDEQLLEYNAEQARAASAAGLQLERRKSDLASYAADKDDANFTNEEAEEAAHKRSSRLRRSTIAPGQDTAAHVAAMTAELNRLADDMLPNEEDQTGREGRKHKQDSRQHKDLRERLLESWDGKTYYERLQAQAERQPEAESSNAGNGIVQESKQPAEARGDVRAAGRKRQSSQPQETSPSSKGLSRKARSGALTPNASKGKLSKAQSPSMESVIMSPELLGCSEARLKASKQEQDRVQAGSPPRPISGRTDSPHRKEEGPTVPPGQPAGRAAGRKRLPPLPLSARGASQGTKSTAAARHAAQPAGNAPKQQQHISSRSEKAPESQRCMPADETVSDDTAAHRSVPDDHSAVPGTRASQHHQQSQQQLAGKVKQAGVPQGAQQGERQGCMGSSGNKMHRSLTISQSEQASVSGTAVPVGAAQAQQQPAPSKGRSSSASLPAHSSPCAVLSSETGASSKASVGSAAERVGTSGVQQSEGGHRGGQQQVARLTASNTALLAELVDLQAAKALLEEQLVQEQNLRLTAEASKETLSQQLAEQQSALAAAKQQVCDLQSAVANLPAIVKQAGSSGALQSSAGTATLEVSLRAVKHHAAALAEAAAALESLEL